MARGLGWLGVAVGVTELAFPTKLASVIGLGDHGRAPAILRAMGLRELLSGVAIFARPQHPAPRWSRVAGDALELGLLGLALASSGSNKRRLAVAIGAIAGITALDVRAAQRGARARHVAPVVAAVTIKAAPEAGSPRLSVENPPAAAKAAKEVTP